MIICDLYKEQLAKALKSSDKKTILLRRNRSDCKTIEQVILKVLFLNNNIIDERGLEKRKIY
jgi:hypothetical protein